ncbi:hypothetical protein [Rhizobium sp. TRM95796]|uniref:hypothetical protein n=1 Tax=Rhizobium sp. TRM95796 TaxID=2979862 RepID=UPI0021E75C82|nr:hypothetical protein [Rhizobium sp. TRM95796]MCV3767529.1 hypothetical protein [Rhizobium sp. TRM95796]
MATEASSLADETSEQPTIFFISREGQFLSRAFTAFCEARGLSLRSRPLIASRTLLLKMVFSDAIGELSAGLSYHGSVSGFFSDRLSITSGQLERIGVSPAIAAGQLSLPADADWLAHILANHAPGLGDFLTGRREAYTAYLKESGYFDGPGLIADVGYSGTIQKLLHRLTGRTCAGFYCIGSDALTSPQSKLDGRRKALFERQGRFGDGNPFLDSTLIFEVLMSADYGQVDDITPTATAPGYRFEFGAKSRSQHLFPLLALGQEAVCRELGACGDISLDDLLSDDFKENVRVLLLTLLTNRQLAPVMIQQIAEVDDRMGGEGFINPWTLLPPLRKKSRNGSGEA